MPTSAIFLLAANAVPLLGVLFWDWNLLVVMLGFWAETAILGLFTILKMLTARGTDGGRGKERRVSWSARLFMVPFFCLHFGVFMTVHGVFVFVVTGLDGELGSAPDVVWRAPRFVLESTEIRWFLLATLLSHGLSFVTNFLGGGERDRHSPAYFMMQPYGRVIVQHVALLVGAFGAVLLGTTVPLLVFLVALKTWLDLKMHRREHDVLRAASHAASTI